MTLHDDPSRRYADPVEVATAALLADFRRQLGATKVGMHGQSTAWSAPGGIIEVEQVARAVLAALDKRAFLSPHYYDATKANTKDRTNG